MRIHQGLTAGLLLAGASILPSIVTAQPVQPDPSPPSVARQRAPGVPMAPRPGALDPGIVERERAADPGLYRRSDQQHAQNAPRPDRDPPMLRPVPSIIAP